MQTLFVIPALNEEASIGRALDSLISQDINNWVAFVGDNKSDDRTSIIARSLRDPRISIRSWESRSGSHLNFLRTAEEALLKYPFATDVRFLAADDWLSNASYLSGVLAVMHKADAVMPNVTSDREHLKLEELHAARFIHARSRFMRSLVMTDWRFVNLIYAHFSRSAFEDLVSAMKSKELMSSGTDWVTVFKWFMERPRVIVFSEESISRSTQSRRGYAELHRLGKIMQKKQDSILKSTLRELAWPILAISSIATRKSHMSFSAIFPLVSIFLLRSIAAFRSITKAMQRT